MDTNSLWDLIDELESVIRPAIRKVRCTQTTPRKKVYSESYLVNRLCQPTEKSKRTYQHDSAREKYKSESEVKKLQHVKPQPNNSIAQNSTRNLKKKSEQSSNKNQGNPLSNNKSDSKDFSRRRKIVPVNILKPVPYVKKQLQLSEEDITKQKRKHISPVRKINTIICKDIHTEEWENNIEEINFKENNPIKESPPDLSETCNKDILSNITNNKCFSQDNSSQVKQLTSYWNRLLSTDQQLASEDSQCQSSRARSFDLLFKKFSEYQNEKREWCFRKDDLVRSKCISEPNKCGISSLVHLSSDSPTDKEKEYEIPKFKIERDSEDTFQVRSETTLKLLQKNNVKLNLFPMSSINNDYNIRPSVPIEGIICQMAEKLFYKNGKIGFRDEPQRLDSNENNYSSKSCSGLLKVTEIDDSQPSERNFEMGTNDNKSKILAIQDINLKTVERALQMLMLCKTHMLVTFILNEVLLTVIRRDTDKTNEHTFQMTDEDICLSCLKLNNDHVEQDDFDDDLTLWCHTKQVLLDSVITIRSLISAAYDNIVFYGPSIERFIRVTYQFFISMLICRIIAMDVFKK